MTKGGKVRTAEEYLKMYQYSYEFWLDEERAVKKIAGLFLQETGMEIGKVPGLVPNMPVKEVREILRKQSEKWRKFAELSGVVRADGYELLLQRRHPEFYSVLTKGVFA